VTVGDARTFDLVVLGGGIVGLWIASEARRSGLSCCIIEKGGRNLSVASSVDPPILFSDRENVGATRARHHVLTGNSAYWGGGLIRNPRPSLAAVLGCSADHPSAVAVEQAYSHVEDALGVSRPWSEWKPSSDTYPGLTPHEILVLTGKARGLWSQYLRMPVSADQGTEVVTDAHVIAVDWTPQSTVRRVGVRVRGRSDTEWIAGRTFVVSMGVIDSCLFVQEHLKEQLTGRQSQLVGRHLHDHWSIPVADIRWTNGTPLSEVFPPKRAKYGILGRRLAFDTGFFHFAVDFDRTPPYDRIKSLLAARQRGASWWRVAAKALSVGQRPLQMLRLGAHYLQTRELFIPDGSSVRIIADFESSAHRENRVTRTGNAATLNWAFREEDSEAFVALLREHHSSIDAIARSAGLQLRWKVDYANWQACSEYAQRTAVDAYHLGGGLSGDVSTPEGPLCGPDGRLAGFENLFVMSTAAFHAPGIANPVLTLLARASLLVDQQARS
jgi:choline dehydrogenase-like flavoprotein